MSTDPWAMVQRAEKGAETDSEIHAALRLAQKLIEYAVFVGGSGARST